MKVLQLTPRLKTIASLIKNGARVADIGTDHAYLPAWLVLNGVISFGIASDIGIGPLSSAQNTAEAYGVSEKISLRLGAGLEKISPAECDTLVIAGMGGETISDILAAAQWTKQGNHTLILQPMTMAQELRFYLLNNGYAIENEVLCREGRRLYTVICAHGGSLTEDKPEFWVCSFSQKLLNDPLAGEYLSLLLDREEKAIKGLLMSLNPDEKELECKQKTVEHLKLAIKENGL